MKEKNIKIQRQGNQVKILSDEVTVSTLCKSGYRMLEGMKLPLKVSHSR